MVRCERVSGCSPFAMKRLNDQSNRLAASYPLGDTVRFSQLWHSPAPKTSNEKETGINRREFLKLSAMAGAYGLLANSVPSSLVKAEEVKPWQPSVDSARMASPIRDWMKEQVLQTPFHVSVMPSDVANQINEMIKAIREGREHDALNSIAYLRDRTAKNEETRKFMHMLRFSLNDVKDSDRAAGLIQKIMMDETQTLNSDEIKRVTDLLAGLFTQQEYELLERIIDETYIRVVPSGDNTFLKAFAFCLSVKNDKERAMQSRLIQKLKANERLTQAEMDVLKDRITLLFTPGYQELMVKAISNVDKIDPTFDPNSAFAVMSGYKPRKPKKGEKPITNEMKERLICKVTNLTKYEENKPYQQLLEHVKGLLSTDDCQNLYDILKKDQVFLEQYKHKYSDDKALKAFAFSKNISNEEKKDRLAAAVRGLPLDKKETEWVVERIALYAAAMYPTYGLPIIRNMLTQLLAAGIDPFPRSTLFGTTAFTNAIAAIEATGKDEAVQTIIDTIEKAGKQIEDKPDFMGRNSLRYLSLIRKTHPGKVNALKRILESTQKSGMGYKVKADLPDRDFGITPLMSAAFMGDENYIKTLQLYCRPYEEPFSFLPKFLRFNQLADQPALSLNVNRPDKTSDKMTVLNYAVQGNQKESVEALLEAHKNGTHRINWKQNKKALELAHDNEASKFREKDANFQAYDDAKMISEAIENQMAKDTGDNERYLPSLEKFVERRGSVTLAAKPQ